MSWVWKHSFRADTFPVVFFCGVAVAMAGGHLVRLARDPHTPFLKYVFRGKKLEIHVILLFLAIEMKTSLVLGNSVIPAVT